MVDAVALDDGAEGVFEQLEADVGEVAGDVGESEVLWTDELHGRAFKHGVMLFAHESGIFDGFLDDVVYIGLCADDADVFFVCLMGVNGNVLADEETNANTREVEAVQPGLHVQTDMFSILTTLPLENPLGNGGDGGVVASLDMLEDLCETLIVVLDLGGPLDVVSIRVVSPFHRHAQFELVESIPLAMTSTWEIVGVGLGIVGIRF